ncbi:MAG TPA: hypothetical protein VJW20_16495 [Candidatus Angelobacter sp.]|nr:hypothetical protein [Candidatus Angelobacter sp.]
MSVVRVSSLTRFAGFGISPGGSDDHPIKRKNGARWGPRQVPPKRLKIVCWRHNWKECPAEIEVVELGKVFGMQGIAVIAGIAVIRK